MSLFTYFEENSLSISIGGDGDGVIKTLSTGFKHSFDEYYYHRRRHNCQTYILFLSVFAFIFLQNGQTKANCCQKNPYRFELRKSTVALLILLIFGLKIE